MLYQIINPSDSYTIDCPDLEIATVACCMLGGGQYGFEPLDDGAVAVPMFLFGGVQDFCEKHFKQAFDDVRARVTTHRVAALADALDSVLIGKDAYKRAQKLAEWAALPPEQMRALRAVYHDKRRTSMNDIGGRAYEMAERLRKGVHASIKAPQQVFKGS